MTLALLDEPQGAAQFGRFEVPQQVPQLRRLDQFAAVSALCRRGKFTTAKAAGLLLREDDPEESFLATRFAFGVETPRAITVDLRGMPLALVGRESRLFDLDEVCRAVNLLDRGCVREWGLRPIGPTHGGKVDSPEFRAIVAAYWEVDENNADIGLAIWLLDAGGADLFFVQPR